MRYTFTCTMSSSNTKKMMRENIYIFGILLCYKYLNYKHKTICKMFVVVWLAILTPITITSYFMVAIVFSSATIFVILSTFALVTQ